MSKNNNLLSALLLVSAFLLVQVSTFVQAGQSSSASGQAIGVSDKDIELLRADLRAQRKQVTAQSMNLTTEEAKNFWPIYDRYIQETVKINDSRWALMKNYADNHETLTDVQAQDYITRSSEVDKQFIALRLKYVPMFEKVVSPKKAALWYQIDRRIELLINVQLLSLIPVVNTTN